MAGERHRPFSNRPGGARARVTRRSRHSTPRDDADGLPQVYREMLAEADLPMSHPSSVDAPPPKRRRVGERTDIVARTADYQQTGRQDVVSVSQSQEVSKPAQTVYDLDASEDSDPEPEWEDVEIESTAIPSAQPSSASAGNNEEPLQLTFQKEESKDKRKAAPRRKPITALERKWRLDIHKVHLLCLIGHVNLRNSWCNDKEVQKIFRPSLPKHVVKCLNPRETLPQFTRSTTFADGLKQASEAFRRKFKVTAPGTRRPYWLDNPEDFRSSTTAIPESAEILQSKEDFRKQAVTMQGSRDFGAQLFCALLRGVDVDARLVCSLQPLPLGGMAKGEIPRKPEKEYIVLSDDGTGTSRSDTGTSTPTANATSTPQPPVRRLGQPRFSQSPSKSPMPPPGIGSSKPTSDSPFPIFWVEAFNDAMQKWVVVDPIVTNTVGRPARFEPPANDRYNFMSYVIAFDEDGFARDVTKRYTKSFNSKTRKSRVEYTKDGERWWSHTMRFFEPPFPEDRDQLEIGELTAKAAGEGMPRNVQDFKNHPIYALERHLRWNEVIHPKREIGKVGLSKLAVGKKTQPLEPVYRRADVHTIKSADGWYRQGKSIKAGEQPLKRIQASRRGAPATTQGAIDTTEEEPLDTPMYAAYQTEVYNPPPVVNGRIPKNAYGNIDIYAPTMVPEGGFHLKHADGALAARILGVDFADAITRFQFKGRHGTAVAEGIVASIGYQEALNAVIAGLHDERVEAEQRRRTLEALSMWKKFLLKLRVIERVNSYTIEGEDIADRQETRSLTPDFAEAGGFFPEESSRPSHLSGRIGSTNQLDVSNTVDEPYESVPLSSGSHESSGGSFVQEQAAFPYDTSNKGTPEENNTYSRRQTETPASASRSRYTLVVMPKDITASAPPPSIPDPEPPSNQVNTERPPTPVTTGPMLSTPAVQNIDTADPSRSALMIPNPPQAERSVSVEEVSGLPELVHADSDSEIDHSSMISHDPEDEDAEPEWLLSD